MLPRLIATDLDGTLLDPAGLLTPRSAGALRAAAAADIVVVFATGRPPMVAGREIDAAGTGVHYGVMANGTFVCTLPDMQVLHSVSFSAATARAAVVTLRSHDPALGFALATDRGFTAEPGFHERMPVHSGGGGEVIDALVGHEEADQAIKLLIADLPAVLGPDLVVAHMGADAVEIGPAGADKGRGLQWLCGHLGIEAADVLVFGDEINDLPMFAVAGRRVAVANAHPDVRAAADEVTGSNADDGVAETIERILAAG
jgi:hydroxymethylpyrimidine pyrophosphatase-like HAD family hydrolase